MNKNLNRTLPAKVRSDRAAFLFIAATILVGTVLKHPAFGAEPRTFPHPDRIHYDSQCLTIDGTDVLIYSGAFHYFRCPKELWADRFRTIKAAGFNTVETYAAWNWHEREMPASLSDFSKVDLKDLDDWLTMAEQFGFYIIVRPGPYICAEWANGGFPTWYTALKPAHPAGGNAWLRSDNPTCLDWSKHWYDAVCPVIARHQVTRRRPGQCGVILVQIENEYNYWKLGSGAKTNYLAKLATWAQADGIDVPLITCLTNQIPGMQTGILRNVFDCTNFYPRWDVEKALRDGIGKMRVKQPDAPLATTELQGGWFSEVGGRLSEQQDGITAAQIQNLTLLAWELGETITNYYMLFGGTNFDDWAARDLITSYDYNAPIRECGGTGDRYARVRALGDMVRNYGAKLVRSKEVPLTVDARDKDVEVAERRAEDGSRFFFVRTSEHTSPKSGTATVQEREGKSAPLSIHYQLEPFGSRVLYLPKGENDPSRGEWLPRTIPDPKRPANMPAPVEITEAERASGEMPSNWLAAVPGHPLEEYGITGSHFLYYKVPAASGAKVGIDLHAADQVVSYSGGNFLPPANAEKTHADFNLPVNAKEILVLYESRGLPNFGGELGQINGIVSAKGATAEGIKIAPADRDPKDKTEYGETMSGDRQSDGLKWQHVEISSKAATAAESPLTWYKVKFSLPNPLPGVWIPWNLRVNANGNGFIYINGHCLGRYWQAGPQRDFFMPECWLNFGPEKQNTAVLELRPVDQKVHVTSLSAVPIASMSEYR